MKWKEKEWSSKVVEEWGWRWWWWWKCVFVCECVKQRQTGVCASLCVVCVWNEWKKTGVCLCVCEPLTFFSLCTAVRSVMSSDACRYLNKKTTVFLRWCNVVGRLTYHTNKRERESHRIDDEPRSAGAEFHNSSFSSHHLVFASRASRLFKREVSFIFILRLCCAVPSYYTHT